MRSTRFLLISVPSEIFSGHVTCLGVFGDISCSVSQMTACNIVILSPRMPSPGVKFVRWEAQVLWRLFHFLTRALLSAMGDFPNSRDDPLKSA